MTKIRPTKEIPKWEKFNCTGRLRVEVKKDNSDIIEVIVLPKEGGCETNLKAIASLVTGMLECNISVEYICEILEGVKPCQSPTARMHRENLPREKVGIGGCPRIIAQAIREKISAP